MEADKDIIKEQPDNNASTECEMLELSNLYLSTAEMLARYAYEASAKQQQMNVLAQQVTTNSVRTLYSIFTSETSSPQAP